VKTNLRLEIKTSSDSCRFCGQYVNLAEEGNTHSDGSVSHESCYDNAQFDKENAADFRD